MPRVLSRHTVLQLVEDLTEDVRIIAAAVALTPAQRRLRLEALRHVNGVVSGVREESFVRPYGSFAMDLSIPDSDLDLTVLDGNGDVPDVEEFITAICAEDVLQPVERRSHSRGVHLRGHYHGLCVDILFDQRNALEVAEAVNRFKAEHPTFEPLVLTLKCLLRRYRVDGRVMSSHILTMSAMAYFRFHHEHSRMTSQDAPVGHTLLYFLSFFRTEGAFDPASMVLLPHAAQGVYTRTPPSPYVVWEVVGLHDQRNDAAGCFRIYTARHIFENLHGHLMQRAIDAERTPWGVLREILHLDTPRFQRHHDSQGNAEKETI